MLSSPGGNDAGFPPSLSPHTGGSLILDTNLESQIVLCNVPIATDLGASNCLTSCLPGGQTVLPSKVSVCVYLQNNPANSEKRKLNPSGNTHFCLWPYT